MSTIAAILPEFIIFLSACLILFTQFFKNKKVSNLFNFCLLEIALIFTSAYLLIDILHWHEGNLKLFSDHFILNYRALVFKFFICIFSVFILPLFHEIKDNLKSNSEEYSLMLFSIFGMFILISANSLISYFLGIELMAIPTYALVSSAKINIDSNQEKHSEASIKYFLFGILGSSLILYGMSILYAYTGEIIFPTYLTWHQNHYLAYVGFVVIAIGMTAKIGLVPLHFWVSDIYESLSTKLSLFIGILPKIALFAGLVKLIQSYSTYKFYNSGYGLNEFINFIAIASIILGNLFAITQDNIKRLFAYSSIANLGFMTLVLSVVYCSYVYEPVYLAYSIFYLISYLITFFLSFYLITLVEKQTQNNNLSLKDMHLFRSNSYIYYAFLISLFSLIGIPPLLGFMAKFFILSGLISTGMYFTFAIALFSTVIGAYYPIKIIQAMHSESQQNIQYINISIYSKIVILSCALLMVIFGIFPQIFLIHISSYV